MLSRLRQARHPRPQWRARRSRRPTAVRVPCRTPHPSSDPRISQPSLAQAHAHASAHHLHQQLSHRCWPRVERVRLCSPGSSCGRPLRTPLLARRAVHHRTTGFGLRVSQSARRLRGLGLRHPRRRARQYGTARRTSQPLARDACIDPGRQRSEEGRQQHGRDAGHRRDVKSLPFSRRPSGAEGYGGHGEGYQGPRFRILRPRYDAREQQLPCRLLGHRSTHLLYERHQSGGYPGGRGDKPGCWKDHRGVHVRCRPQCGDLSPAGAFKACVGGLQQGRGLRNPDG